MHVLVTGSCGYKGSVLVPKLLRAGHEVTGFDACWFGERIEPHANYRLIKGDLRELQYLPPGIDAAIHLAGIANDPCGELDARLTWEVNVLYHQFFIEKCIAAGVKQIIYSSSASVYGIQGDKAVTEDTPKAPVSDYNKSKICAERVLLSYADKIAVQIVRPATICGYSPRFRADVVVNMLTMDALENGEIVVKTPDLYRPHCHIQDVTDLYLFLLARPHLRGPYNAGFQNQTIMETASIIAEHVGCKVKVAPHTPGKYDKRSYLVDSTRLLAQGFRPAYRVEDAVKEIVGMYRAGALRREPWMVNLTHMQAQGLVSEHR